MRRKPYKRKKRGPVVAKKVSYDGINFASGLERYMYLALKKAKIKAVQEGISLKQLFTRALEKELDPEPESKLVVPLKPKVDNSFRSSLKTGKTGSLKASK